MSFRSLLTERVTIKRATYGQTAAKSMARSFATVGANVPARIDELSIQERVMQGREGVVSTHRIFLPRGTSVESKDEIWVGTQTRYAVDTVSTETKARRAHHVEVLATLRV